MKQITAVMNHDDSHIVMTALAKAGYSSTCTDSRGGFLGRPNSTLFTIVDDIRVREVIKIIEENSKSREYDVPPSKSSGTYNLPARVRAGGAVIAITDVDQFYKL